MIAVTASISEKAANTWTERIKEVERFVATIAHPNFPVNHGLVRAYQNLYEVCTNPECCGRD